MNKRRSIIKGLGVGTAWVTPIAQSVMLPAHAATTVEATTTPAPNNFSLGASLDQAGEFEPTGDQATATASMAFNSDSGDFTLIVTAVGFNDFTAAHIHVGPAGGMSGPVVIDIASGHTGNGNINFAGNIPADKRTDVLTGNTYVNLHNIPHPNGAIRGQLTLA